MKRFCVFCGRKPEEKNKEHVIPQWLIAMTGAPSRKARFGLSPSQDFERWEPREYAFSSFAFPACTKCNDEYHHLETSTKPVILKLLARESISASEISGLLDWMDKVRVGLWLGYQMLDRNVAGITPRFYISQRIGKFDRMFALAFGTRPVKHLSFVGVPTFAFRYAPTVFGLVINNMYIFNVSQVYLFAPRLGFPEPTERLIAMERNDMALLRAGRHRVLKPIIRAQLPFKGAQLFQPMFPGELALARPLYDTSYVREHCQDWDNGIGGIFAATGQRSGWLSDSESPWWMPNPETHNVHMMGSLQLAVLQYQKYLLRNTMPSYERAAPEIREHVKLRHRMASKELDHLIRYVRTEAGVNKRKFPTH
jgi:hypothetical protein